MLNDFHFIRPWCLLALGPLAWLVLRAMGLRSRDDAWQHVVDAQLMPLLQVGRVGKASRLAASLLGIGWLIATLALADPTWERRPQPVFQTQAARVIVLDLSPSMNAVDLKPSRLVRARYKVEDVLAQTSEGQTGLVAYAGDAFTVSPLTRDANTIRSLLRVLEPDLMPAPGDRADLGLAKAGDLLRQAGLPNGQVLLIADGIAAARASATNAAAARLRSQGYTVSVLGIGTAAGGPVAGKLPVSPLDTTTLEAVAAAGGGSYATMSADNEALRALLSAEKPGQQIVRTPTDTKASSWHEQGPVLLLFLLPLAALAFRRNWLLGLSLAAVLAAPVQSADAATWRDLWQRPDQQAATALAAGDYAQAVKAAAGTTDAALRGSAEFKAGNYAGALNEFSRASGADADYNRGNTLARLGRYPEAVAAYDKSIAARSVNDDARANKAAVEALMKRQPPKSDPSKGGNGKDGKGDDSPQGQGSASPSSSGQQGKSGQSQTPSGAGGQGDASANPAQQGKTAPASDQPGSPSGQPPGQPSAAAPSTPPPQGPGNPFAQAAQKLDPAAQGQKANANGVANGVPDAGQAGPGDAQRAGRNPTAPVGSGDAQPLQSEERLAAAQWLRRIPDDPGGLLRRKFLYQYRQRQQPGASDDQ
ncbi:MAG: VWA domain-containing protein [Rhodoferax sp.]|uniref:VWA domain-containing protein n=1 Tax=Rhodoferax sp. TaxID=50421 RepID=UPI0032658C95